MARKVVLPRSWHGVCGADLDEVAPDDEYEALKQQIATVRDRQLSALRDEGHEGHYDADDSAVRARLYMKARR